MCKPRECQPESAARIAILHVGEPPVDSFNRTLTEAGFTCCDFFEVRRFVSAVPHNSFALVVLNSTLHFHRNVEVILSIRRYLDFEIPILLITGTISDVETLAVLEAGADCHSVYPMSAEMLVARASALLKRNQPRAVTPLAPIETFGRYTFHAAITSVNFSDCSVRLTEKEFSLALFLFRHKGHALSSAQLTDAVWLVEPAMSSRTLTTHVSLLRKKLRLYPANGYALKPIYGFGYRLDALGR